MTRQEILTMARDMCGETMGSAGERSPGGWQKTITEAADEIARKTQCWHTAFNTPIRAYEADYCCPEILEAQAIIAFTNDGVGHTLPPSTTPVMDDWSGSWRNETAASLTGVAVTDGLNRVILYPTPNWSSFVYAYTDLVLVAGQGGFKLSSVSRPFLDAAAPVGDVGLWLYVTDGTGFTPGWYRIDSVSGGIATVLTSAGTASSTGGTATLTSGGLWMQGPAVPGETWDALGDECPLPERIHMGVVWGACAMRTLRNIAHETDKRRLAAYDKLQAKFEQKQAESVAWLGSEVRRFTRSTRVPANITGNAGSMPGLDDPLNLIY